MAEVKGKLFSLRIEADVFAKLEKIAKREDRSIAYVVRKALDEYVKREGK